MRSVCDFVFNAYTGFQGFKREKLSQVTNYPDTHPKVSIFCVDFDNDKNSHSAGVLVQSSRGLCIVTENVCTKIKRISNSVIQVKLDSLVDSDFFKKDEILVIFVKENMFVYDDWNFEDRLEEYRKITYKPTPVGRIPDSFFDGTHPIDRTVPHVCTLYTRLFFEDLYGKKECFVKSR
jgi:hypothetical protein